MNIQILEDYLQKLNPEQYSAATLGKESAIILAAAGSGKTSTLTARIAYLIVKEKVSPHNILAVTFTNKAAKEMNSRLFKMGLEVKNIWVGTFHGICNKILRFHAEEAGLRKSFYIMDSQEQESFFKRALRANGYDPKVLNVSDLLSKINGYKEVGWRSNQLKINTQERTVYEIYEQACKNDNCVDFGELLLACYELFLKNEAIADSYAEKFHHILVDEFQDTNELQYKWLKLLAAKHKNIFAVGDDDQCFVKDTLITVKNNEKKPIQLIENGDQVVCYFNKRHELGTVVNTYKKTVSKGFIKLKLENGIEIESTPEHVFLIVGEPCFTYGNYTHVCKMFDGESKEKMHRLYSVENQDLVLFESNDLSRLKTEEPYKDWKVYFTAKIDDAVTIFKQAKHLMSGDEVYVNNVGFVKILSCKEERKEAEVFDIDVKGYHTFFANDILVHNSIYSFRGAKPENINLLKEDFNAKLIKIEKNYRSDANILEAANAIIAHNTNRQGKNLVPTKNKSEKILVFPAFNDEEESSFIAQEIKTLRRAGVPYQNMAILYRTNGQSRSLEKSLNAQSVPYIVYGGFRFFDRQEVKHAMAYLRLALNPKDNMAFLRVANIPVRSIGDTTLKKLEMFAQENGYSLFEAAQNWSDKNQKKLIPFVELIEFLQKTTKGKSLPDMVKCVIVDSGLEKMYEEDKKEGPERLDNLYELISAAEVFVIENKSADIEEFLAFSTLETDVNTKKRDENVDAVKLMTVHASKGLEFDVVFVSGLEESLFPHANSLNEPSAIEEERRLMYVAVTRAKKRLYLSHSEERLLHGTWNRFVKSRFMREVPVGVMKSIR